MSAQASQEQQLCLGIGCPSGSLCGDNVCCPPGLVGCGGQCCSACCGGACCAHGQSCCFGACVDTQTDPSHCGGRGQICMSGMCVGGACSGGGTGQGNGQGSGGSNNMSGGALGIGETYTSVEACRGNCTSGCCCTDVKGYYTYQPSGIGLPDQVFVPLQVVCHVGTSSDHCGSGGQVCKGCSFAGQACVNQSCCVPADQPPTPCCPSQNVYITNLGLAAIASGAGPILGGFTGRNPLCCQQGCCDAHPPTPA